jgi:hypothetical protein
MTKRIFTPICALVLLFHPMFARAAWISPSVIELSSSLGEVIDSSFTIFNTQASEQVYFLDLLAFEPSQEDGTPRFAAQGSDETPFLSWIHFPVRDVSIDALTKVDVPFQVAVPDDVAAGSYWGAITVSTAPSDIVASNGAIIEAKTAVLVFLTVTGETVEKLEILDFSMSPFGTTLPFGTVQYRLQNQGNVHLTPVGEVKLVGLFGQTIASVDANQTQGRILPSSTRIYEFTLGPEELSWLDAAGYQFRHLAMGPITTQLHLDYGQTGTLEAQVTLWVIPWELLSLVAAAVLVLVLFYKKMAKR